MVELQRMWRGLKRLILTSSAEESKPAGEPTVTGGRYAITVVGQRLGAHGAGTRGEVATAAGLAMSGMRATTWLTGLDPALALIAEQRLPVVAHVALSDDASFAAYQAAVQAGWVALHPQNVQEAVDLTLAAHHLAEHALTPVIVALDNLEIAEAIQDVMLPDTELCRAVAGRADESIQAPTPAQKILFGEERRRIPRYFDLDRPTLHGVRGPGLAAASGRVFFSTHVRELLVSALEHTASLTGRALEILHRTNLDGATRVLVARGAAVELCENVAGELAKRKIRFAVLGLRCPTVVSVEEIDSILTACGPAIVLQPEASLKSPDTTITRLLRDDHRPAGMQTAYYGFSEHPLRAADLLAFSEEVHAGRQGDTCLGLTFLPEHSDYPKREILLQALRRDYGDVAQLGLRAPVGVDLRGPGALTVAINRSANVGGEELAPGIAAIVGTSYARVRSRIDKHPRAYGATSMDFVSLGPAKMRDAGADVPAEVLVLLYGSLDPKLELVRGGAALIPLSDGDGIESVPKKTLTALFSRDIELFTIHTEPRTTPHETPLPEVVLGALCGVLRARDVPLSTHQAIRAREAALSHLAGAECAARVAEFATGIESVHRVQWKDVRMSDDEWATEDTAVPHAVRNLKSAATFASVPRFWDQVGVLYRKGEESQLSPDPFQATGVLPPLTATFHDLSTTRRTVRVFEPQACTGCGECWTVCPDSALGPAAVNFEDLITTGMTAVKVAGGANADALRPMVGRIAARADLVFAKEDATYRAGPVLRDAFDYVMAKAAPAGDRRESLATAFDLVIAEVEDLPIARTKPFFDRGKLLTVAVHVEACKACGACTEVCATGAIIGAPQTVEHVRRARKNWELFERLPEAADGMIAEVADDADVGLSAAVLLDQHCMFSMSGGDAAEPGSGEKIAVHLALAAAEHLLRPRLQQHLQAVADLEREVRDKIQELLAGSLPTQDLATLEEGLDELPGQHVDLSALAEKVESAGNRAPLDAAWLRALVHTARELQELRNRLQHGLSGLGRARVGMLVAPGNVASWAAVFPYNPFSVPVVLDSAGATAEMAKGLCLGQLETVLEDVRLLRRARLELARPVEAQAARPQLATLTWQDLTPEERYASPPLLLVGGEDSLGSRGLTELATVLSSDLPIKLLVLAGLDFGLQDDSRLGRESEHGDTPHGDTGLLAMAHRRAYVVQSSVGDPDHLVRGCLGAFAHDGPALLNVHAPSPRRHGFATHLTREQGRRALESGVLPRFTYDPDAVGLFGLRLSLQDSPHDDRTFADFACTEGRFAHHFTPLPATAADPTPLVEYLAIEPTKRAGRTPFVQSEDRKLEVSAGMVRVCDDRRHSMRVLMELSGIVTPFTDKVESAIAEQMAGDHEQALDTLRAEYEGKLATMRVDLQREFTERLRDRLVELTARHRRQPGATR